MNLMLLRVVLKKIIRKIFNKSLSKNKILNLHMKNLNLVILQIKLKILYII